MPPKFPPSSPGGLLPRPARRAWLGFSALAVLTASSAHAQQMSGMTGASGSRGHRSFSAPTEDAASKAAHCAASPAGALPSLIMVQSYVDERLNKLPAELGLSAQATPAFERYASSVTRLMSDEVKRSLKPPPEAEAARTISQQITDASNRLAAWEDVQQTSQALMSQLSPDQQAIASKRLVASIEPKNWMGKTSL